MTEQKILIVDDDEKIRKMIHDTLQVENYEVIEAGDGVDGFAPGDRVTGLYAYLRSFATYGLAEPHQLLRVPDHIPSEQALAEPLNNAGVQKLRSRVLLWVSALT